VGVASVSFLAGAQRKIPGIFPPARGKSGKCYGEGGGVCGGAGAQAAVARRLQSEVYSIVAIAAQRHFVRNAYTQHNMHTHNSHTQALTHA